MSELAGEPNLIKAARPGAGHGPEGCVVKKASTGPSWPTGTASSRAGVSLRGRFDPPEPRYVRRISWVPGESGRCHGKKHAQSGDLRDGHGIVSVEQFSVNGIATLHQADIEPVPVTQGRIRF